MDDRKQDKPKIRASRRPRPSRPSTSRGRVFRLVLWMLALVVLVGGSLTWMYLQLPGKGEGPLLFGRATADMEAGDRAVVLVFPTWDGTSYKSEERQVQSRDRLEEDLLTVMVALCEGPRDGGTICAIPDGTRPLGAFYDEVKGSAVIDFSRELVTGHPGGSAAESATLTSILRTVALNFPEIRSCHLLVDGGQSMTLAGHLMLDRPFDPRRWL